MFGRCSISLHILLRWEIQTKPYLSRAQDWWWTGLHNSCNLHPFAIICIYDIYVSIPVRCGSFCLWFLHAEYIGTQRADRWEKIVNANADSDISGAHCHWFILFAKVVRGHPVKWIARHCGAYFEFIVWHFWASCSNLRLAAYCCHLDGNSWKLSSWLMRSLFWPVPRTSYTVRIYVDTMKATVNTFHLQDGEINLDCFLYVFYLTQVSTVDPPSIPILDYVIFVYFFSPPWAPLTASD